MKKILYFFALAITLSACGVSKPVTTKATKYPDLYSEKPITLLVMPPINKTDNVEAKELLYTSVSYPLIEKGYYVISPLLAMEVFKQESAYDSEVFINGTLEKFGQAFGADAVVFSEIERWEKQGTGIHTDIRYIFRSTHTNKVLFERYCKLYLSFKGNYSGGSFLTNLLVNVATGLVQTAANDHIRAARIANSYIMSDLPVGTYSGFFGQDGESAAENSEIEVSLNASSF